jgi:hypothetical protein
MPKASKISPPIKHKRSQEVLKTSIDVLNEYALFCKDEGGDGFISIRDLYSIVYQEWREEDRQVSWTQKEFSSLLSTHIRQPIEGISIIEKKRKVNKHGGREIHYKVMK